MTDEYGVIEYRGFQLTLSSVAEEGWRIAVTRIGNRSRELNSIADSSMDRAIDEAKRWIDQIESWRSQK
jgi:hypothetical protein